MNRGPGHEEDQADHHQQKVGSSSSCQLSLLSLTTNCVSIFGDSHPWSRRDGNSVKKKIRDLTFILIVR